LEFLNRKKNRDRERDIKNQDRDKDIERDSVVFEKESVFNDSEFLRYFLNDNHKLNNHNHNHNLNNNFNNFNKENNSKTHEAFDEDILNDLKFSILKNSLIDKKRSKNENNFEKKIEKSISKEILYLQMARLYKEDNKMARLFIMRKLNEIIMEDDLYENMMLLSYFQKLKEKYNNKNKGKKNFKQDQNMKKIFDLFSKDALGDFDLNQSKYLF